MASKKFEKKINTGSILIFLLTILLILCLTITSTLAYFAGKDESKKVLMTGGPVRVVLINRDKNPTSGEGQLILKIGYKYALPGMGVDMQAIARISSTAKTETTNPTPALLRALVDVLVDGNPKPSKQIVEEIRIMIINSIETKLSKCIPSDMNQVGGQDGWVRHTDNNFYYCDRNLEDSTFIMKSINYDNVDNNNITTANITFLNGVFTMPTKDMVNKHSETDITIIIRFEALQSIIPSGETSTRLQNTIFNAKNVFDKINWNITKD